MASPFDNLSDEELLQEEQRLLNKIQGDGDVSSLSDEELLQEEQRLLQNKQKPTGIDAVAQANTESGGTDSIIPQLLFGRDEIMTPEGKDFMGTLSSIGEGAMGALPRIAQGIGSRDFIPTADDVYEGVGNLPQSLGSNYDALVQMMGSPLETGEQFRQAINDPAMVEEMIVDTADVSKRVREDPVGLLQEAIPGGRLVTASNKYLKHLLDVGDIGRGSVATKAAEGVKYVVDELTRPLSNRVMKQGKRKSVVLDEIEKIVGEDSDMVDVIRDVHRDGIDFQELKVEIKDGLSKYDKTTKDDFINSLESLPTVAVDSGAILGGVASVLRDKFNISIRQQVDGSFDLDFDTPRPDGQISPFPPSSTQRKEINAIVQDVAKTLATSNASTTLYGLKRRIYNTLDNIDFIGATEGESLVTQIGKVLDAELHRVHGQPFDDLNRAYEESRAIVKEQKKQLPIDKDGDIDTGKLEPMLEDMFFDSEESANKLRAIHFLQDAIDKPLVSMGAGLATKNRFASGLPSFALQTAAFISAGGISLVPGVGIGAAIPVGIAIGRAGRPRGMANLAMRKGIDPNNPLAPNLLGNTGITQLGTAGQVIENKRQRAEDTLLDQLPINQQR